jgi:hypothetical protein
MTDAILTAIAAFLLIILESIRLIKSKRPLSNIPPTDICRNCPLMREFQKKVADDTCKIRRKAKGTRNIKKTD